MVLVLALVAHAMIPEAINAGGSLVVLPTVAGFLFARYLALAASSGPALNHTSYYKILYVVLPNARVGCATSALAP